MLNVEIENMATQTSRKRAERPSIVRKTGVMGGAPTIAGHRIRVADIVTKLRLHGDPAGVHKAYPHLTMAQIKVALDFYEKHKDEIDQYIREEEALASESRGVQRFT
jgi:uncharacterized protein (DUF433 family)